MFAIFGIFIIVMLVYSHEIGHQSIFASYGIDSKIKFGFEGAVTIGEKPCPSSGCLLAHNIHDSIMSHVESLMILIIMGFLFLIIQKENNEPRNN